MNFFTGYWGQAFRGVHCSVAAAGGDVPHPSWPSRWVQASVFIIRVLCMLCSALLSLYVCVWWFLCEAFFTWVNLLCDINSIPSEGNLRIDSSFQWLAHWLSARRGSVIWVGIVQGGTTRNLANRHEKVKGPHARTFFPHHDAFWCIIFRVKHWWRSHYDGDEGDFPGVSCVYIAALKKCIKCIKFHGKWERNWTWDPKRVVMSGIIDCLLRNETERTKPLVIQNPVSF